MLPAVLPVSSELFCQENIKQQNLENKSLFEKIINNQQDSETMQKKEAELLKNYKETTQKNQELILSLNANENKIKALEEQNFKLNLYKDIIHSAEKIQCKYCENFFTFENFKNHYEICFKNSQDPNFLKASQKSQSFMNEKIKIKILKGKVKTDELGKPYLDYIMDISYGGQNWRINKRFSQFANLYKTIKNA